MAKSLTLPGIILALVLAACIAPGVQAHGVLLSSIPPENALLDKAPPVATLQFNELVTPLVVQLVAPDGTRTDLTDQLAPGALLTAPLDADLPEGTYVLSWRVVSEDGHPIAGSQVFSLGQESQINASALQVGDTKVSFALWLARGLLYICLFAGVGGALFGAFVAPLPRLARSVTYSLLVSGVVLAAASLGLQGLDALGRSFDAIAGFRIWSTALDTSYGPTAIGLMLSLLLATVSLTYGKVLSRVLSGAALLAMGGALAASGHASAADPQWLTRPAVSIHVAAVALWLGALLPLGQYLLSGDDSGRATLKRFSTVIPWAVAPLIVSGAALIVVQMGWPSRLWLAPYGLILLAKLVLLVGLFGLALINRVKFTGAALEGRPKFLAHLQTSIRAEIVIAIVILLLVAGWRFTPPPRALKDQFPEPAYASLQTDDITADVVVDPARPGPVAVDVSLARDGAEVEAQSVMVSFSQPELGIEPFTREAQGQGGGHYRIDGMTLPAHGVWNIRVDVRLDRFSSSHLDGTVTLEKPSGADIRQPEVVASLGPLQLADPFTRATLPGAKVGGGYLVIINTGTEDDRIVSAISSVSGRVTPHEMKVEDQIMRMREMPDGIPVPAGQAIRLAPGGLHLMLEELKQPIIEGSSVPLTLTFERAGTITVQLQALGISAGAADDHSGH